MALKEEPSAWGAVAGAGEQPADREAWRQQEQGPQLDSRGFNVQEEGRVGCMSQEALKQLRGHNEGSSPKGVCWGGTVARVEARPAQFALAFPQADRHGASGHLLADRGHPHALGDAAG